VIVSLASRRALAALGAALGVLPLLPGARGLAARLAGPPILPGMQLLKRDIKATTYAELAVLVVVVSIAAFFFGRLLPDWIRSRGGFAVALPGLCLGASFLLWRYGVRPRYALLAGAAAAAAATLASIAGPRLLGRRPVLPAEGRSPAVVTADDAPPRAGLPVAVAIALLVVTAAGFRFFWNPHVSVDLFEDGHLLTPAQSYLAGAAPYADTYPIHGWGYDGGFDAAAFRLLGPTLESMRLRRALFSALAFTAIGLAAWVLFRRPGWALLAFLLAFAMCPFASERHAPAFAGLAALIWAAETGRRRAWLAAGLIAGATVFYTLDFGIMLSLAAGLTAVALAVVGRSWRYLARAGVSAAIGALLGALPFVVLFARRQAFDDFFRVSFLELPRRISDIWSLPAASATTLLRTGSTGEIADALLLGRGVSWISHAALLALASSVLLFRAARREFGWLDRGAAAATLMAFVAMRGALGRADEGHLLLYGVFAALPAAWLLYRAAHAPYARWVWVAALGAMIALRLQPQRLPGIAWSGLVPSKTPAGACLRQLARSGRAKVPCSVADDLEKLRSWMDRELEPQETFFDFGNEPGLYFLLDRRPPIRYCCVPFYEGPEGQREVIAALERERPPVAILSSGTFLDELDDVPNRVRAPLVAAYLDRRYEPIGRIGSRTIGRRRPEP
jgi:hypothetical protein